MSDSDASDSQLGELLDKHLQRLESQTEVDSRILPSDADCELAQLVEDLHHAAALLDNKQLENQQFGKYQIEKVVGRGGQSITLLALDADLQRKVVLKIYQVFQSEKESEEILREGRLLCRVESPYVVKCYAAELEAFEQVNESDAVSEPSTQTAARPYLVLQYVEGLPLDTRLRLGGIADDEITDVIQHLARGLQAVHEVGIYHRDIKPGNIVLGGDGTPVLIDFGLAVGNTESVAEPRSGTAAYMSPEQARGVAVDARSDIFGLGAVMYHMLTGYPPYRAEDPAKTIELARAGEIDEPRTLNAAVDPFLTKVCMKCLEPEPDNRFQTPGEVLAALNSSRSRVSRLGMALLALLILVGSSLFLFQGRENSAPTSPELAIQVVGGEKLDSGIYRFFDSDDVSLKITPNQSGYLYVFSIEDDNYRQLYPNAVQPLRLLEADEVLEVPKPGLARIRLQPSRQTELFRVVLTAEPWLDIKVSKASRGGSVFSSMQPPQDWLDLTAKIRDSIERGVRSADIELVAKEGRTSQILIESFIPFRVESSARKRFAEGSERRRQQLLQHNPLLQQRYALLRMTFSERIKDLKLFDDPDSNRPEVASIVRAKAQNNWTIAARHATQLVNIISSQTDAESVPVGKRVGSGEIDLLRFCADAYDSAGMGEESLAVRKLVLQRSEKQMLSNSQREEFQKELQFTRELSQDKSKQEKWRQADRAFCSFLLNTSEQPGLAAKSIEKCIALRRAVAGKASVELLEPLFWQAAWLWETGDEAKAANKLQTAKEICGEHFAFQRNRFANLVAQLKSQKSTQELPEFPMATLVISRGIQTPAQRAAVFSVASQAGTPHAASITDQLSRYQQQTMAYFDIRRQMHEARVKGWNGELNVATNMLLSAREKICELRGTNNAEYCELNQLLASYYREQGKIEESKRLIKEAWSITSAALEESIRADVAVTHLTKLTWQLFSELLCTLDLNDPEQVEFAFSALSRSRALVAWSEVHQSQPVGAISTPLSVSIQAQKKKAMRFVSIVPSFDIPSVPSATDEVKDLVRPRSSREDSQKESVDIEKTAESEIEKLAAFLPQDTAIVEFVEMVESARPATRNQLQVGRNLGAFVVTKQGPQLSIQWFKLGSIDVVERLAKSWQTDLEDLGRARELAAHVWTPLEQELDKVQSLVLVPYRGLAQIPWNLLPCNDGNSVIDKYRIRYAHSSHEVIESTATKSSEYTGDLLAVGGLDYASVDAATESRGATVDLLGSKWRELPQTQVEVQEVSSYFDPQRTEVLDGGSALQTSVQALMPRRKIIHFATHAYFEDPQPYLWRSREQAIRPRGSRVSRRWYSMNLEHCGLVLSNANDQVESKFESESFLTGSEIANMQLGCVDLVVLSACDSGVGEQYAGEGPIGLQRAFHFAGARSVIASLWNVDDKLARLIMRRFYDNLLNQNMTKASALRDAQLGMRNGELTGGEPQPPQAWAGWILSGAED